MLQKTILCITLIIFSAGTLLAQENRKDSIPYYPCYVGTSLFLLGNFFPNPPSFYQLNFGYRITPKDVISLEAVTWKYNAPLGIPYGPSWEDPQERYPGSIREFGIGIVYQRFLWKKFYASLQVLPLRRIYLDETNATIQKGFRLFSTFRLGYHAQFFKNRVFIEPSIAATFFPISTNVPSDFAEKDAKWNKYFLFEPGMHVGVKF